MLNSEQKWNLIHAYRKGVVLGEVPAIKCPDCGDEMVPVVARSGDPALRCLACRAVFEIGIYVWDQIRSNISEAAQNIRERE